MFVDDLQWADDSLRDLLRYVHRNSSAASILICCLARDELAESHPEWKGLDADEVVLGPLSEEASRDLVAGVLGAPPPSELSEIVLRRAGGNPLFAIEIVESLLDRGLVSRKGEQWEVSPGLDDVGLPSTVEAVLAARIEALESRERAVLEAGAVVGETFWDGAIAAMDNDLTDVETELASLVTKNLIVVERSSSFPDLRSFRFSHGLIREAAYRSISKRRRATLEERIAGWLSDRTTGLAGANEQIIGTHLELAYRCREDLGPIDSETEEIGRRAGRLLGQAGRRNYDRGAMGSSRDLLERAVSLLSERDRMRPRLLWRLAAAVFRSAGPKAARQLAEEAAAAAKLNGDRITELIALQASMTAGMAFSPPSDDEVASIGSSIELMITELEGSKDAEAIMYAYTRVASQDQFLMKWDASFVAIEAMREARPVISSTVFYCYLLANALRFGPAPVDQAVDRLNALIECGEPVAPGLVASATAVGEGLSPLEAMRGNFDRARELFSTSVEMKRELDARIDEYSLLGYTGGPIEIAAGNLRAAEEFLEKSERELASFGETTLRSGILADLAQAQFDLGRPDDAERSAEEARRLTGSGDPMSQIRWRRIGARLLARRGDSAAAVSLGDEAIGIAARTDAVSERADALLDLARVEREVSHPEPANERAREALRLYQAKGHLVGARRASEFLAES